MRPSLVFLEASDKALIRRFEETRRPHPLGRDLPVREGIRLERMLLKPMRQLASVVIDTTRLNVHELRDLIQTRFGGIAARRSMLISTVSFGYRFGVPPDADLVFDVRFLPNPNFVPRLKNKTGRDVGVRRFMDSYPQTHEFMSRLMNLLLYLLPQYVREGKELPDHRHRLHGRPAPLRLLGRRGGQRAGARRLQDQGFAPGHWKIGVGLGVRD